MFTFTLILVGFALGDFLFWRWLDAELRRLRHNVWRYAVAAFFVLQVVYLASLCLHTWWHQFPDPILLQWAVGAYLWHLAVLPIPLAGIAIYTVMRRAMRLWRTTC